MYKHTQVFGLSRDFAHAISPWVCNNFLFFTRSNGLSFMDWCTWKLRYVIPSWELPTPQMILASAWDQELPHSNSSYKSQRLLFQVWNWSCNWEAKDIQWNGHSGVRATVCLCYIMDLSIVESKPRMSSMFEHMVKLIGRSVSWQCFYQMPCNSNIGLHFEKSDHIRPTYFTNIRLRRLSCKFPPPTLNTKSPEFS